MIELPDWRDGEQYPNPNDRPPAWWAWQFLRRNPEYQADYRQWAEYSDRYVDEHGVVPQDDWQLLEKWRIKMMPDPREANYVLLPLSHYAPEPQHRGCGRPALHECVLKFDLRYSVDRQIEYAAEYLKLQKEHFYRVHDARGTTPEKFTAKGSQIRKLAEYLRALDAKLSGAKPLEIAAVLYPLLGRVLTRDPGPARAEFACKAGKMLSEGGYIDLASWG